MVVDASVTVSNVSYIRVMHGKKLEEYEKDGAYLILVRAVSVREHSEELPCPYYFPTGDPSITLVDVTFSCICAWEFLIMKTLSCTASELEVASRVLKTGTIPAVNFRRLLGTVAVLLIEHKCKSTFWCMLRATGRDCANQMAQFSIPQLRPSTILYET